MSRATRARAIDRAPLRVLAIVVNQAHDSNVTHVFRGFAPSDEKRDTRVMVREKRDAKFPRKKAA